LIQAQLAHTLFQADGKTLMIASNRRGGAGMDDYVVDPFHKTFQLTSQNEGTELLRYYY